MCSFYQGVSSQMCAAAELSAAGILKKNSSKAITDLLILDLYSHLNLPSQAVKVVSPHHHACFHKVVTSYNFCLWFSGFQVCQWLLPEEHNCQWLS